MLILGEDSLKQEEAVNLCDLLGASQMTTTLVLLVCMCSRCSLAS
jgi:hypothetical protein